MELFKNNTNKGSLEEDKAWTESLLNEEGLRQFNKSKSTAPIHYFESFPEKLLSRIKNEKKSFVLPTWSLPLQKWAVAAMLIMVVGISYLFLNNSISSKTNDSITYHTVALEDLSNEEIETYVDANEWMTEIDTQTQLQKENNNLNFLDKEQIEEIKKTIIE